MAKLSFAKAGDELLGLGQQEEGGELTSARDVDAGVTVGIDADYRIRTSQRLSAFERHLER